MYIVKVTDNKEVDKLTVKECKDYCQWCWGNSYGDCDKCLVRDKIRKEK